MPTVYRSDRFKICVYADDHPPPHIHVVGKDFRAVLLLAPLRIDRGRLPPGILAEAVAWAADNLETLQGVWEKLNERD